MKTIPEELKNKLYPEDTVLLGFRGSYAQNTYIPNTDPNSVDDTDLMSVYLAEPEYYTGLGDKFFTFDGKTEDYTSAVERFINEWDVVSYEIRKFFQLLLKSNPNVLSLLWIKDEYHFPTKFGWYGKLILENKHIFSSKIAFVAFIGYAQGQLKRMTHHAHMGYMGDKRKKLVEKYGYDTKNAAHLIRLMHMAIEFLNTGELNVFRTTDYDMLRDIKLGKWELDAVKNEANKLFDLANIAKENSPLPDYPDREKAGLILRYIIEDYIYTKSRGIYLKLPLTK